ncbi:MAG TPA: hypothetical protein VMD30_05730 [Tepidisphaeraceae bacterium]|nr:hypothetical protein [Tepidisphaeraceae bacterium]
MPKADYLNRLLDPVGKTLTPNAARRLLAVRADARTQARINKLAKRCNEGKLTSQERSEYESLVSAASIIAVLQSKARQLLSKSPAA